MRRLWRRLRSRATLGSAIVFVAAAKMPCTGNDWNVALYFP
jgi:hypothetical protein